MGVVTSVGLHAQYVQVLTGSIPLPSAAVVTAEAGTLGYTPAQVAQALAVQPETAVLLQLANSTLAVQASGFSAGPGIVLGNVARGDRFGSFRSGNFSAYCIDFGKATPTGSYSDVGSGSSGTNGANLDYLLATYGATSDPTTAAAIALIVHGVRGDDGYPLATLLTGGVQAAVGQANGGMANSVNAKITALWNEATTYRGPYTVQVGVTTALPARGARVSFRVRVLSSTGNRLPGIAGAVSVTGPVAREQASVVTDSCSDGSGDGCGGVDVATSAGDRDGFTIGWSPSTPVAAGWRILSNGNSSYQRLATGASQTPAAGQTSGTVTVPAATPVPPAPPKTPMNYGIALAIAKATKDPAYVSADGATFSVVDRGTHVTYGTITIAGGTGKLPSIPITDGNSHTVCVTERSAPTGVLLAPAQCHDFSASAPSYTFGFTGPAADDVVRGSLTVHKTTTAGAALAGATFTLLFDSDNNASYETPVSAQVTDTAGTTSWPGLLPGHYDLIESAAPAGYAIAVPQSQAITVPVSGGAAAVGVTIQDPALVPARFAKTPTPGSSYDPGNTPDLAGAQVTLDCPAVGANPAVHAVITLAADGTGGIGPQLVPGVVCTWTETTAPANNQWALGTGTPGSAGGGVPGGTFTAGTDPSPEPVAFTDTGQERQVTLVKHETGRPDVPVPGAVYDLCAAAGATMPGGWSPHGPPVGSPAVDNSCSPGETYVSSGTTDDAGHAPFAGVTAGSPLPVGVTYCAHERVTPADWLLDPAEHCADNTLEVGNGNAALVIDVAETPQRAVSVAKVAGGSRAPAPGVGYGLCLAAGQTLPAGYTPPTAPTTPTGVTCAAGETPLATATTDATGTAAFPGLFPGGPGATGDGVHYGIAETSVPAVGTDHVTYLPDTTEHYVALVDSDVQVPLSDPVLTVTVGVRKTQVGTATGLPGAVYAGCSTMTVPGITYPTPPTGSASIAPAVQTCQPGETWLGSAMTGSNGETDLPAGSPVPAGATVCVYEVTAPAGFDLTVGRTCQVMLTASTIAVSDAKTPPTPPTPSPAPTTPAAQTGSPSPGTSATTPAPASSTPVSMPSRPVPTARPVALLSPTARPVPSLTVQSARTTPGPTPTAARTSPTSSPTASQTATPGSPTYQLELSTPGPVTTPVNTTGSQLAFTGAEHLGALLLAGLLAVGLGGALLLAGRRRRKPQH